MVFDTRTVSESSFMKCNWKEYYQDTKEVLPPDTPEALSVPVVMECFVDADHDGYKANMRSHTGVIVFLNNVSIIWFSKRSITVNISTFGSETVAVRITIELVEIFWYKLRMTGFRSRRVQS